MHFAVLFVSAISAWLASGGFSVLLMRFTGPVEVAQGIAATYLGLEAAVTLAILAWLLSFGLQLMLVTFWSNFFFYPGARFASFCVGLVFSFFSMSLSSGMAVYQLEVGTLQTRAADQARAPLMDTTNAVRTAVLDLVRSVDTLALAAERKAALEVSEGGTCAESQGRGAGPIQSRSILHSNQAADVGRVMQSWAYAVEDAADALSLAKPLQADINERVDVLRELFRDPRLSESRVTLASLATDMDPLIGWSDANGSYKCTDPDYAAAIASTIANLESLMTTSIATPRLTETTPADGFASVWEAVIARIGGRDTDAVGEIGLLIAFIVELVQIGMIHISAATKRRQGQLPHRLHVFADAKSPKRPSHRVEKDAVLADTLRDHTIRYAGKRWFASSVPPTPKEYAVIVDLELPEPRPLFSAIPRSVAMQLPEFSAVANASDAAAFDLRKIPSDLRMWSRTIERDKKIKTEAV